MRGIIAARVADDVTPSLLDGLERPEDHGAVCESDAHPQVDRTGRISIVHDGVVENADALRATLVAQGHVFRSAAGSEVVVHLVERALAVDDDLLLAVRIATAQLEGSWAIVVLDAERGRMVVAAEHAPLVVARSARGDVVARDVDAIPEWAETSVALRDGDVVELGDGWRWTGGGRVVPTSIPSPFSAAPLEPFARELAVTMRRAVGGPRNPARSVTVE